MIGIYKIINNINGKVYIGQSIHIEKRIKEHFWKSQNENDISYNSALHSAIRKYGKENFTWEVVEECSIEDIDIKEQQYIIQYKSLSPNGYNISPGGQKKRYIPIFCSRCGAEITSQAKTGLCVECAHIAQRKTLRPTKEELNCLLHQYNFCQVGRIYNVTDNTIRKWCKSYGLSTKAKDYK